MRAVAQQVVHDDRVEGKIVRHLDVDRPLESVAGVGAGGPLVVANSHRLLDGDRLVGERVARRSRIHDRQRVADIAWLPAAGCVDGVRGAAEGARARVQNRRGFRVDARNVEVERGRGVLAAGTHHVPEVDGQRPARATSRLSDAPEGHRGRVREQVLDIVGERVSDGEVGHGLAGRHGNGDRVCVREVGPGCGLGLGGVAGLLDLDDRGRDVGCGRRGSNDARVGGMVIDRRRPELVAASGGDGLRGSRVRETAQMRRDVNHGIRLTRRERPERQPDHDISGSIDEAAHLDREAGGLHRVRVGDAAARRGEDGVGDGRAQVRDGPGRVDRQPVVQIGAHRQVEIDVRSVSGVGWGRVLKRDVEGDVLADEWGGWHAHQADERQRRGIYLRTRKAGHDAQGRGDERRQQRGQESDANPARSPARSPTRSHDHDLDSIRSKARRDSGPSAG